MRTLRAVNLAALVGMIAWTVWAYGDLPPRYPVHFDLAGNPDRWAEASPWLWAGLPLVAALTSLLLPLGLRLGRRSPELLNVPRKRLWLELDPTDREPILERMAGWLDGVVLATTLLLWAVQGAIFDAAVDGTASIGWVLGLTALYTLGVLGAVWVHHRRTAREIEALHRRRRTR